jgi:phosphoribosylformylglycinamidine (FGAM) synthase PurS component
MSTSEKIQQYISKASPKTIFFAEDFKGHGGAEAIKSALHRLVKVGELKRLAKGIYIKPGYSELLKTETVPPLEEVAMAIARRDGIRVLPTGAMALYKLGLSTQVPMKAVYLTDGSARTIRLGKSKLTFKRVTPKKLMLKGELSRLVVQALGEIGKANVEDTQKSKIVDLLKDESYENLKHDIKIAPQWMGEIMAKAL